MNITFLHENSAIKVEFAPTEMKYLSRVSRAVGIPLSNFGGLSNDSPYILIRVEQLCSFAEDTMDIESMVSTFGVEKKLSKLESMPECTRGIIRKGVIKFISEKIPKGFFMKKQ